MKEEGVEVLESMGERHKKRPLGRVILAPNTYAHRTGIIDIQIALSLFLDLNTVELNFFEVDFEVTGANRGGKEKRYPMTKIHVTTAEEDYIIPDFACSYFYKNNTPFFLWEYHRGEDAGRFIRQLIQHTRAIKNGSSTEKYHERVWERNPRILCVFEQSGTRNAVARRVLEDGRFSDMYNFFLFATLDDVKNDISTAFKHLSDQTFSFLE